MNAGQSPSIPGPYHSPEQTESFPLKQAVYGGVLAGSERSRRWKSVLNCCTLGSAGIADEGGASLRVIVVCFMVLSFAVAIALAVQIYYGDYQLVPHGSVATDSRECSVIGTEILKKGGNAVDAAVAATFCLAVTNLHVTGIGGGGFMLIYSHRKRKILDAIDFREMAPSTVNVSVELPGSMVGVPGFVMGLSVSHNLHGKLPWKDVVMPAVRLARSGFKIPQTMIWAQSRLNTSKYNTKLLAAISVLEAGKNLTLPKLAGTLELIAERGPYVLYNGSLSKDILATIAEAGGLMTAADLLNFKVKRYPPQNMLFTKYNIHVPGLPSGGPLLLETLKSLNDLESAAGSYEIILKLLADSSRETYSKVLTGFWGDPSNTTTTDDISGIPPDLPEPAGSHVAAVDLNDMYVSVVSGLNTWYGSQLLTNGSFVLNNALQNFGQGSNKAGPGRRPLSLATPIIAVEANRVCGRRLILGAGDALVGAQLLSHLLVLEKNLGPSVEAARFRTLPSNNISWQLGFEDDVKPGFGEKIQTYLTHAGYHIIGLKEPYQSCNAVEKVGDSLTSHSDSRGGGVASRF